MSSNLIDWDEAALDAAIEFARDCQSSQLVVMDATGVRVYESWRPGPVDVYAVQKGVLAILFGMAEDRGLLDLVDCVNHHLDPEWTQLPPEKEASLTIETLLTMTTGMNDDLAQLGTTGETWRYNNTAYNYLKKILCLHTGKTLNELSREWLFDPLGMKETQWVDRAPRLPDGSPFTGLLSTAFDLARVGKLIMDRGNWEGTQLVPGFYIEQLAKPGSQQNPAWGLCWWNNHSTHHLAPMREEKMRDGPIVPTAPAGLIAARGMFENYLYVVPEPSLVVSRVALPPTGNARVRFEREFWERLMLAI